MLTKILPANDATIERILRVVIGLGVLSLVFVGPKSNWGLLGIIPLFTGAIGSCPIYTVLGFSTAGKK